MARFDAGWIKLHRSLSASDVSKHPTRLAVFVTLLLRANRFETEIDWWTGQRRPISPGSMVIGLRELARQIGASKSGTARALKWLQKRDTVQVEAGPDGTLVTLRNWADYQLSDEAPGTRRSDTRDDSGTQVGHDRALNGDSESSRRRNSRFDYPKEFEEIYRTYPRSEGKQAGFKIYQREIKNAEDRESLLKAIRHYQQAKNGAESKYLLMFGTFMNQWGDWLDVRTGTALSASSINTKPIQLEENV